MTQINDGKTKEELIDGIFRMNVQLGYTPEECFADYNRLKNTGKTDLDKFFSNLTGQTPSNFFNTFKPNNIKISGDFSGLELYENTLISVTGRPGAGKSTIMMKLIKEIVKSNNLYHAAIFQMELNKDVTYKKLAGTRIHLGNKFLSAYADRAAGTTNSGYIQDDGSFKNDVEFLKDEEQIYKSFIKNYIDSGKIAVINRADFANLEGYKDDTEIIEQTINYFYNKYNLAQVSKAKINNLDSLAEYKKNEQPHLVLFIDYFDILSCIDPRNGKPFPSEYDEQRYLIERLKDLREQYPAVTFIIIHSMNKTGLTAAGSQANVKGNTSIVFGYDSILQLNKFKNISDLKAYLKPDDKKNNNSLCVSTISGGNCELTEDDNIIIIEDTKARYKTETTLFFKASKDFRSFTQIKTYLTEEKPEEKRTTTKPVSSKKYKPNRG